MLCGKCGAPLPEGAQFCAACGTPVIPPKHTVGVWRRFFDFFIDAIVSYLINILLFVALSYLPTEAYWPLAILLGSNIVYYGFFEGIFQRTPGKWITKTKVVRLDGSKPHFVQILGRTLIRLIPFEWISFLFGDHPFGWHDRWSGTMVVPAAYTAEEIAAVNTKDKGKTSAAAIVAAIALGGLFLIAILGILSGVVLASLDSARSKGANAGLESSMHELAVASLTYQYSHNSYKGFCTAFDGAYGGTQSTNVYGPLLWASKFSQGNLTSYVCNDSEDHWVAAVPEPSAIGGYVCLDDVIANNAGEPKQVKTALTSNDLQCPIE